MSLQPSTQLVADAAKGLADLSSLACKKVVGIVCVVGTTKMPIHIFSAGKYTTEAVEIFVIKRG